MVEGEDVDIGRLCEEFGLLGRDVVEYFDGERVVVFGGIVGVECVSGLCCVCMRVFTTSRGVVMTPAMPPALAAVAISSGRPMMLDPM